MSNKIMIDLETLGVSAGARILSIGAVVFDEKFNIIDQFYANLLPEPSTHEDERTREWWDKQPFKAKQMLSKNQIPAINALSNLTIMMETNAVEEIWCNGASFDFPILGHYFDLFKMERPWKFWNERDLRTMKNFFPVDVTFESIPHYAIDDCKFQLKQLKQICQKIK